MKTAEQYAGRFFEEWFGHTPAGAHQLALCAALAEHFATALADARALPGAMAPPDVEAIRARLAQVEEALPHPATAATGGQTVWDHYARDVSPLLAWSDYLAGWVHDLLLDRGAYDARREGEAAGLRRAADFLDAVHAGATEYHPDSMLIPALLHQQADSLGAGPPPPPARLQADLAACRAALAGLLRVLETEEGDDLAVLDRALDAAHAALGGQPR